MGCNASSKASVGTPMCDRLDALVAVDDECRRHRPLDETRGGADRLWSRETMGGIAAGMNAGRRLRARVGYGTSLRDNWIGTPGMTITEYGAGRRLQFDYEMKPRNRERQ